MSQAVPLTDSAEPHVGPPARASFRRDIQGLRAVAVLSVALDHAHFGLFSGGFVGVDVFFVISGFLITQLLLAEAGRNGRISLTNFYSRRARRILPAATVVTLATTVASVLLLDYVRATAIIHDAVWATFFAANVHFSRVGTDYFAAGSPQSPLQHYWSLAIEEQFYVLWPVLLAALYLGYDLWRRRRSAAQESPGRLGMAPVLGALVVIGGCSLVWSLQLTEHNQTAAYFSTPARVWELAMGAACAALAPRLVRLASRVKILLAWAGLVCIGVAVFGFSASTPYPGRAALLPVIGAALVIAGGCGLGRGGPDVVLGLKPFQLVGDWSYSLYLWHWPFLIIAAGYAGHELTATQNLLLLVAATATSYITYRFVENPFRRPSATRASRHRGLLLYPLAIALTLIGCVGAQAEVTHEVSAASSNPAITIKHYGGPPDQSPHFSRDRTIALVEASVQAARNGVPIPGHLRPALLDLVGNHADTHHCNYQDDSVRRICPRGDVHSDKVLVLYGDSHAKHWIPALDPIVKRAGYRAYYLVKPRCGAAIEAIIAHQAGEEDHMAACTDWQDWAMGQVAELRPDVVVVSEDTIPLEPDSTEVEDPALHAEVSQRLDDTVTALTKPGVIGSGGRLVMIGDPPGLALWPGNCLSARDATLLGCALQLDKPWASSMSITRDIARTHHGDFINPTRWFCADRVCPAVIGSMVTYRDEGHITTTYSEHLSGALGEALALAPAR